MLCFYWLISQSLQHPSIVGKLLFLQDEETENLKIIIGNGESTRIIVAGKGSVLKLCQWHRISIYNASSKGVSISNISISSKNNHLKNKLVIVPTLIYDDFYRVIQKNYFRYPIFIRAGEAIVGQITIPIDLNPKYKTILLDIVEVGQFGFKEPESEYLKERTKNIDEKIKKSITKFYKIEFTTGSGKIINAFLKSGKYALDQVSQVANSDEKAE